MNSATPTTAPDPKSDPIAANRAAAGENRIAPLAGDRPCTRCGFNLHGQMIVREGHYGLLIVRCPECGTPAALQEYPALSNWTGRLRALFALVWLAAIVVAMGIGALVMWGFSETTAEVVFDTYSQQIQRAHSEHLQGTSSATPAAPVYATPQQVQAWWASQPPAKFLADRGGLLGAMQWSGLLMWTFPALIVTTLGMLAATLCPRARGGRLLVIWALVSLAAASFYALSYFMTWIDSGQRYYWGAYHLAELQIGWLPAIMTLVFTSACYLVGLLMGRRVARWLLAVLLPPRLLVPFSDLWLADGLDLPRVRP